MTHAALKDLLPCPFCGGNAKKFSHNPECDNCDSSAPDADTWNRRSISAMEGEAVAWPNRMVNLPCPDGSTDRIVGFRVPEGDPILGKHGLSEPLAWLRKVTVERTAPLPQQANGWTLEQISGGALLVKDPSGKCWHCIGAADVRAATNPTPSPGPQGGGDDYKFPADVAEWFGGPHDYPRDLRDAAEERDELLRDYVKLAKALGFAEYADFEQILAAATPPAHQPGEVVTDEMVELGLQAAVEASDARLPRYSVIRAIITAALAPKEDGHDR